MVAAFKNVKALIDADIAGQTRFTSFRKRPVVATTAGVFFDLSLSPGNPAPQFYAASPLIAIALKQSTDGGIYHGGNVSPASKFLRTSLITLDVITGYPATFILCDYLMFYPFIDEGTTDDQPLTNIVTLPRYTDGAGVRIMAVSVAPRSGGQTFRCTYTNQSGVSGRVTPNVIQYASTTTGEIISSQPAAAQASGLFLPLQSGDTGVRSIESVQMVSGVDVGLFTLVLVRPLATTTIVEVEAAVENEYFNDSGGMIPKIEDDAYLNYILLPSGSINTRSINGFLTFTFN